MVCTKEKALATILLIIKKGDSVPLSLFNMESLSVSKHKNNEYAEITLNKITNMQKWRI